MNKTIIQVPKGIRYFNQFEQLYGFHLEDYPYILDKKLPGCGFTTWVLTNSQNVILASPRKLLMINKKEQIGESIFLVNFEYTTETENEVDKDMNKVPVQKKEESESTVPAYNPSELRTKLSEYMLKTQMKGLPFKILVTYDSYRKIKEILDELKIFQEFYTIVDEMQSLWIDVRFKPTTEIEFFETLKTVQRVCFVSATPMMEEYLDLVDDFCNLPYHELDWITLEPNRVRDLQINYKVLKSINTAAKSIIDSYKEGRFEEKVYTDPETGKLIKAVSKEAVIYINSVTNIIGIIKACNLKPEEVNILCSDTEINRKKINLRLNKKKQGIIFEIGKVPTKGKPRKMFTFCTRTVYLGADFYSDNARTFIFSDANIETLAVDISLDLAQIMGRQRLDENPWKYEAILYVKSDMKPGKLKEEDCQKEINRKLETTKSLLRSYGDVVLEDDKINLTSNFEKVAKAYNYRDDYIAVNHHAGSVPVPVFNHLVAVAEKRAFDMKLRDYSSLTHVFNGLSNAGFVVGGELSDESKSVLKEFNKLSNFRLKMEYICQVGPTLSEIDLAYVFSGIPVNFKNFYIGLGPDRCKALGFNHTLLKKDLNVKFFSSDLIKESVLSQFNEGQTLSTAEIKSILKDIYSSLGYKKTAKASDLEDFFGMKAIKLKDSRGKWVHGFELLKKKV